MGAKRAFGALWAVNDFTAMIMASRSAWDTGSMRSPGSGESVGGYLPVEVHPGSDVLRIKGQNNDQETRHVDYHRTLLILNRLDSNLSKKVLMQASGKSLVADITRCANKPQFWIAIIPN